MNSQDIINQIGRKEAEIKIAWAKYIRAERIARRCQEVYHSRWAALGDKLDSGVSLATEDIDFMISSPVDAREFYVRVVETGDHLDRLGREMSELKIAFDNSLS